MCKRERVDVAAQRGDNEGNTLRHQAGDERDVAAETVELGHSDLAPGLLCRLQRGL